MLVKLVSLALALFCVLGARARSQSSTKREIIIPTRYGRIRGTTGKTIPNGRTFYGFRGIPYARPPLGELRMEDPVPYGRWEVPILNATAFGPACPQYFLQQRRVIGDEDCLYLNVYTPKIPNQVKNGIDDGYGDDDSDIWEDSRSKRKPKSRGFPVMLWLYGGGYVLGQSQDFGPEFLLREDVVLVTVNYRLGALGFLSTGNSILPGNYALLDIVVALKWIHHTITDFGGDPQRVLLFGDSVGAAMSHMLSLSPLTKGLLHRVILQSGSGICDWSIDTKPLKYARELACRLDCPVDDTQTMVDCIKTRDARELVLASVDLNRYSTLPLLPAPVVDKYSRPKPFLPDTPRNLIKSGKYRPIPMMIGVNLNEGVFLMSWILFENLGRISSPWFIERSLLPGVVEAVTKNRTNLDAVIKAVKDYYFNGIDFTDLNAVITRFTEVIGDLMFTSCAYETEILHAKRSPVYAYLFDYLGEKTPIYVAYFIDIDKRAGIDPPVFREGASHLDEIFYLFNVSRPDVAYSPNDVAVSRRMTKLWANFAAYGNPTPDQHPPRKPQQTRPRKPPTSEQYSYETRYNQPQQQRRQYHYPLWFPVPPYTSDVPYFSISTETMSSGFRKAEYKFWTKYIRSIRNSDRYTWVPRQTGPPCCSERCDERIVREPQNDFSLSLTTEEP